MRFVYCWDMIHLFIYSFIGGDMMFVYVFKCYMYIQISKTKIAEILETIDLGMFLMALIKLD